MHICRIDSLNSSVHQLFSSGCRHCPEFLGLLEHHLPCFRLSKSKKTVALHVVEAWRGIGGSFYHSPPCVPPGYCTHIHQTDLAVKKVVRSLYALAARRKKAATQIATHGEPVDAQAGNLKADHNERGAGVDESCGISSDGTREGHQAIAGERDEGHPQSGRSAEERTLTDNAGDNDDQEARRLSDLMMTFFQQFDPANGLFMGDECRDKIFCCLDDIEHNMKDLNKKLSETTQAKPRQASPTNENDQGPANLKLVPNETGPSGDELRGASKDETRGERQATISTSNEGRLKNTRFAEAALTDDSERIIGKEVKRVSDVVITFFQQLDSANGLFMGNKFCGKILSRLDNIERNVKDLNKKVEHARKG